MLVYVHVHILKYTCYLFYFLLLQRKCELYYPEKKEEPFETSDGIIITLQSITPYADFEEKKFKVENVWKRERETERETERERETGTERDRDRERQRETERDRETVSVPILSHTFTTIITIFTIITLHLPNLLLLTCCDYRNTSVKAGSPCCFICYV